MPRQDRGLNVARNEAIAGQVSLPRLLQFRQLAVKPVDRVPRADENDACCLDGCPRAGEGAGETWAVGDAEVGPEFNPEG